MGHACTFYMARRDHDYISWWPHVLLLAEKFLCVTSLSGRLFRIFIPRRHSGTRDLAGVCFGH